MFIIATLSHFVSDLITVFVQSIWFSFVHMVFSEGGEGSAQGGGGERNLTRWWGKIRILHSLMGGLRKFHRNTNKICPLPPSQAISKILGLFVTDDDTQPSVSILMGHR